MRHLFRVTAGLDSMVLGEAEIQGQVRRSYDLALSLGTSGPIINRLFQDALRVGKRVRTETGICRHKASVASVAVELARRDLGALDGRRALVIGAGKHGALTARALMDAGVQTVYVANRARDRAEDLARRFGGTTVSFDDLAGELRRCDLVLTCTSCPAPGPHAPGPGGRGHRPAPRGRRHGRTPRRRAVGRGASRRQAVRPGRHPARDGTRSLGAREAEAQNAVPIIEQEVVAFARWLASLEVVPTISALRERGRAAVERALRENEPRWQALTDHDRERVELIALAVISDLLHEPTVRLRQAGEQGSSSRYVETVRELFGLTA